ncbi:transmembrane channel-like protein 7 isoform X1 [Haliotis rufescens]|uniref:transmembrane channel-like protein 7 isoform X1 n=1 Tax=Haliotis rufescens TaxID=6454 RepID=UPI00201EFF26|nr:transmembrane channel-like protein 7 isoform X1 [Haliotis rufescens]
MAFDVISDRRFRETRVPMDSAGQQTHSTGSLLRPSQASKKYVLSRSQVSTNSRMSLGRVFSHRVLTNHPREQNLESKPSWGPMVGQIPSRDQDEVDEDFLGESVHSAQEKRSRLAGNIRAKLGFWKLKLHDFKIWYRRNKNKNWELPVFTSYIKTIESNFGSGIGTFFVFTRWVILLNIALAVVWLGFVVLPTAVAFDYSSIKNSFSYSNLLDGQGPVGESWVFFCAYTPQLGVGHLQTSTHVKSYHTGLAYLTMIIVTYFGSLLFILRSMASGMQPAQSESARTRFCFALLTFTSWDHSISSPEAAVNLSKGIASSLKDNLYGAKAADLTEQWTRSEKVKVYGRRITAWFITMVLVGAGCTGIVYLVIFVNFTTDVSLTINDVSLEQYMPGFKTYITPISFSLISMIVPLCIYQLPKMEHYASGKMELNVTLIRIFTLRMANLFALIVSLYNIVNAHSKKDPGKASSSNCMGTVIGQELYKLVIMDTIIHTVANVLMNFMRYYWTMNKIEFNISSSVLVLIYRQALIWIGTLACPVLPLIGTLSDLVFFFLMYGIIKHTGMPPIKRWAQSRNTVFFMTFLLLSLICILVPVAIVIGSPILDLGTTHNATVRYGPFSTGSMPSSAYQDFVKSLDVEWLEKVFMWGISDAVVLPLFFILLTLLVYQRNRISGEAKHGVILQAELQQEREDNKNLMKKIRNMKVYL